MSDWQVTLRQTSRWLIIHGAIGAAAAIGLLAIGVIVHDASTTGLWFFLILPACTVVMLGQSAHLLLDAALFRLALASDSEEAALRSIDTRLHAMGLRRLQGEPRALAPRIAGTRRLLRRQYLVLSVTVAILAISLFEGARI